MSDPNPKPTGWVEVEPGVYETEVFTPPIDLSDLAVTKVLWAAMCSMVMNVHAPQNNLTDAEWQTADVVFKKLDEAVNNA